MSVRFVSRHFLSCSPASQADPISYDQKGTHDVEYRDMAWHGMMLLSETCIIKDPQANRDSRLNLLEHLRRDHLVDPVLFIGTH
ncbi:hypothetical protein VSDG_01171 [Cytospora chrysosperma]|uniref:Uncharacterized protein n=1 Tax=Cytospora chrysosperma TaxID=252740 RepID=A0A423WLN3_CYTCH|nr:hypothetical protein VSDG_01171 [Valsa sordida]